MDNAVTVWTEQDHVVNFGFAVGSKFRYGESVVAFDEVLPHLSVDFVEIESADFTVYFSVFLLVSLFCLPNQVSVAFATDMLPILQRSFWKL